MTEQSITHVSLYHIAHGRTGDKGNRSNISVIAYSPEFYQAIVEQVTTERVGLIFQHRMPRKVTRFLLPKLHAINYVLDDVLDGGVNDALNLDSHGKSLSCLLLDMDIALPTSIAVGINVAERAVIDAASPTTAGKKPAHQQE
ncbi:MAG: hypothetical protein WBF88_14600 [Pusillimonas sp.]